MLHSVKFCGSGMSSGPLQHGTVNNGIQSELCLLWVIVAQKLNVNQVAAGASVNWNRKIPLKI